MPEESSDTFLASLHKIKDTITEKEKKLETAKDNTQKFDNMTTLKKIVEACILKEDMTAALDDAETLAKSHDTDKEEELKLIQELRTSYARFHEQLVKTIRNHRKTED
jgi:hypothetical protein